MKNNHKQKILTTLKKAKAHLEKIITMVEKDQYCIDVIQQLNAISGYIDSARNEKLSEHLQSCFIKGLVSKNEARKKRLIEEVIQVIKMSK